ncbi:hypothetical protein Syun_023177 [Stephania yunnanensis]|uniref:Uncharacterized protein n=1 Tax=Stephania yunnanensis TaxID=152371 RepID=A0AAP0F8H0_9MAGN
MTSTRMESHVEVMESELRKISALEGKLSEMRKENIEFKATMGDMWKKMEWMKQPPPCLTLADLGSSSLAEASIVRPELKFTYHRKRKKVGLSPIAVSQEEEEGWVESNSSIGLKNTYIAKLYEKLYMEELKLKSAGKGKAETMEQNPTLASPKSEVSVTDNQIKKSTSSAEQDLDVFLLGDLASSEEGPDDDNDGGSVGDFDDEFDEIVKGSDDEQIKSIMHSWPQSNGGLELRLLKLWDIFELAVNSLVHVNLGESVRMIRKQDPLVRACNLKEQILVETTPNKVLLVVKIDIYDVKSGYRVAMELDQVGANHDVRGNLHHISLQCAKTKGCGSGTGILDAPLQWDFDMPLVLTMPKVTVLPANPNILEDTDDLVQLSFLNEPSVLHNLCCRYSQSKSYGKLIDIHFKPTGKVFRTNIQTFLFEKMRVFHVFYQLCYGAPSSLKGCILLIDVNIHDEKQ